MDNQSPQENSKYESVLLELGRAKQEISILQGKLERAEKKLEETVFVPVDPTVNNNESGFRSIFNIASRQSRAPPPPLEDGIEMRELGEFGTEPSEHDEDSPEPTVDSETGKLVYNSWTKANTNTVRNWKSSISRSSFVYDNVLEKYRDRLNMLLVWALIVSGIITLISGMNTILTGTGVIANQVIFQYITLCVSAVLTLLGIVTTSLNGYIKIYKLDTIVTEVSNYIKRLDAFYGNISSELILPPKLRQDAVDFIKKEDINFTNLSMNPPDVPRSDCEQAGKKYEQYVQDSSKNFKLAQKYNQNDSVVDMV